MGTTTVEIEPGSAPGRLDRMLADRLGISRARVRHLLEVGRVRRGDRVLGLADKAHPATPGERFEVVGALRAEDERPEPRPDLALVEVASGAGWLVVDKPAGRGVHPLRPDQTDTVLNAVVARHPQILGVGEGGLRSGVVHRLDVDTTGALLFATDEPSWRRLRGAFSDHRIEKRYIAIVAGRFEGERRIDVTLEVTRERPARVEVRAGGRPARQRVRAIEPLDDATLVEVVLETGFLHQIRASLAHVGHPLLGDVDHGGPARAGAARPMLHARILRLGAIDVDVAPPADFEAVRRSLGGE